MNTFLEGLLIIHLRAIRAPVANTEETCVAQKVFSPGSSASGPTVRDETGPHGSFMALDNLILSSALVREHWWHLFRVEKQL